MGKFASNRAVLAGCRVSNDRTNAVQSLSDDKTPRVARGVLSSDRFCVSRGASGSRGAHLSAGRTACWLTGRPAAAELHARDVAGGFLGVFHAFFYNVVWSRKVKQVEPPPLPDWRRKLTWQVEERRNSVRTKRWLTPLIFLAQTEPHR